MYDYIKTIAICHLPNQQKLVHILKAFFNWIGILVYTYTDESIVTIPGADYHIHIEESSETEQELRNALTDILTNLPLKPNIIYAAAQTNDQELYETCSEKLQNF